MLSPEVLAIVVVSVVAYAVQLGYLKGQLKMVRENLINMEQNHLPHILKRLDDLPCQSNGERLSRIERQLEE